MVKAPAFLRKYFWDIDFAKLDPKKHSTYVIERLLEFGDEKAVRWVLKEYSRDAVKSVVCHSRAISKKTANFWSLVLDIPERKIRCLQQDFQETHRAIWPY